MTRPPKYLTVGAIVLSFVTTLSFADEKRVGSKDETAAIFHVAPNAITNAIMRAFGDGRYRGMFLEPPSLAGQDEPQIRTTNGFLLVPVGGAITNVPYKKTLAPYLPCFQIIIQPTNAADTRVIVRTPRSQITDGLTVFAPHGGKAELLRNVPPFREEETNVLKAIERELITEEKDQ